MTLGDKIRKYRSMRKMTQRDLGKALGFPAASAEVRISQYEKNKMAPKADKRKEIADILDIDISSLSDNNIDNIDDIIKILFELEDDYGIQVERIDGKTHIIFDNTGIDTNLFDSYLYLWSKQQARYNSSAKSEEDTLKYDIWKARFLKNMSHYWNKQYYEGLRTKYDGLVKEHKPKYNYKTGDDLIYMLKDLIEAKISINFGILSYPGLYGAFSLDILLSEALKKNASTLQFTELFYSINYLREEYNALISHYLYTKEDGTHIVYLYLCPFFMNLASIGNDLKAHYEVIDSVDDWSKEMFKEHLEQVAQEYKVPLKDNIVSANQALKEDLIQIIDLNS